MLLHIRITAALLTAVLTACGSEGELDAGPDSALESDVGAGDVAMAEPDVLDGGRDVGLFIDATGIVDVDAPLDVLQTTDAAVPRPLDPYEALFQEGFRPRDAAAIDAYQVSGVGIHCLGAALALRRSREGAAFDPSYVVALEEALVLSVRRLLVLREESVGGWGEREAVDFFNDGTTNSADTADGFNTSYATWCLAESAELLGDLDEELASEAEVGAVQSLRQYRAAAYVGPAEHDGFCDTCGYFWYSRSRNDRGRFVKNITSLMGFASLQVGLRFGDEDSETSGREALRSHAREIGGGGTSNLTYLSRLDEGFSPTRQQFNTHNYIESFTMLRAGEQIRSETYVCRAWRQYRAWIAGLERCAGTCDATCTSPCNDDCSECAVRQRVYAACQFARRDTVAFEECRHWVEEGGGLTNPGGFGLLANYWPEDARSAETMCD